MLLLKSISWRFCRSYPGAFQVIYPSVTPGSVRRVQPNCPVLLVRLHWVQGSTEDGSSPPSLKTGVHGVSGTSVVVLESKGVRVDWRSPCAMEVRKDKKGKVRRLGVVQKEDTAVEGTQTYLSVE